MIGVRLALVLDDLHDVDVTTSDDQLPFLFSIGG